MFSLGSSVKEDVFNLITKVIGSESFCALNKKQDTFFQEVFLDSLNRFVGGGLKDVAGDPMLEFTGLDEFFSQDRNALNRPPHNRFDSGSSTLPSG
ncbi:MAG: hypothetical protein ACR2NF_02145 [Pirellulales bacterium]